MRSQRRALQGEICTLDLNRPPDTVPTRKAYSLGVESDGFTNLTTSAGWLPPTCQVPCLWVLMPHPTVKVVFFVLCFFFPITQKLVAVNPKLHLLGTRASQTHWAYR